MNLKKLSYGLVIAAASLASFNTYADRGFDIERKKMMEMPVMTKAEFLEMAGKMYDMKAEEMGAKDGKMTPAQTLRLAKAIYGSGK